MPPIHSLREFDRTYAAKLIPELGSVPSRVFKRFRSKLEFVTGGLAHADYSMLAPYLSDDQLPPLFAHFGITKSKFLLGANKACSGTGSGAICFTFPGVFCSAKCGHGLKAKKKAVRTARKAKEK